MIVWNALCDGEVVRHEIEGLSTRLWEIVHRTLFMTGGRDA
jgi:hypothetical protein